MSTTAAKKRSTRRTNPTPASTDAGSETRAMQRGSARPRRSCPALAGALHQRGRAMPLEDVDQQNLAAMGLDDLVADDLFAGVIAALYQHGGPDLFDQFDRR